MACCGALSMSCCPWGWAASLSSKDHTLHGSLETPLCSSSRLLFFSFYHYRPGFVLLLAFERGSRCPRPMPSVSSVPPVSSHLFMLAFSAPESRVGSC